MPKRPKIVGWDELPKRAQLEVRLRLSKGLGIRHDPDELYAGLCGALTTQGDYCKNTAGRGTKRKGWGRCKDHPGSEKGLAPWYGAIPEKTMFRLGADIVPGKSTRQGSHEATDLTRNSLEDIFSKYLDPDEVQIMQLAISSPVELLGVLMGVRSAGLLRITRYIQDERRRVGPGRVTPDLVGAEATADRTAQTVARLAEARKSWLELDQSSQTQEAFRDLLRRMSDEDLVRAKSDPRVIAALAEPAGGADIFN